MEQTMWERIFNHLKQQGIDVYPPATHQGECKSRYAVLKESGSSQFNTFSTEVQYYNLLCYVPKDEYTSLKRFVKECEGIMGGLAPMIMPTGLKTPDFYDDSIKAHMVSIQYRNYVRNKSL